MLRYMAVEVLTRSFLGVPWSPSLFALLYFEETYFEETEGKID